MAATGGRIEAYSYSDDTTQWQSTHTLAVNLGGVASVRHPTPMRLEPQLATWASLLDTAKPAGAPWALSYSSTTRRVTVASAGAVFSLVFPGNVGPWLGFTQGTLAGLATYTGDAAPAGLIQCQGVGAELGEMIEQVEQATIRHGRSYSYAWGFLDLFAVDAWIRRDSYPWQVAESLTAGDPTGGWAVAGRVRVFGTVGTTGPQSEAEPAGYVDGFVTKCEIDEASQTGQLLHVRLEVARPSEATGLAEPTGLWGALRYGWDRIHWCTIAGIGTVWTERATGLTLPTGFTAESATLDIDDCGPIGSTIDRSRGIGTGLPVTFKLRDSTAIAAYMRRPTYTTNLALSLAATGATVTVKSTTGWPASGRLHCGLEAIDYTGTGATTFTGCTRGRSRSIAVAHALAKSGQVVTDSPRIWQGRDVRLYALACDPTGAATGSALVDDSEEIWRGRLAGQVSRQVGSWQFNADALDRVVDRKLAGKVSGRIIGWGSTVVVDSEWYASVTLHAKKITYVSHWGPYTIAIHPFSALTTGQVIPRSQAINLIASAWSAAVTVLGIGAQVSTSLDFGDWPAAEGGGILTSIRPVIKADANLFYVLTVQSVWGNYKNAPPEWQNFNQAVNAQAADVPIQVGWSIKSNPLVLWNQAQKGLDNSPIVQIDEGAFDLITPTGKLQINSKNASQIIAYESYTEVDGLIYFKIKPAVGDVVNVTELAGATVNVWAAIGPLSLEKLMLTALQTSGTGTQGTYDTESQGAGYGIDCVDESTFLDKDGQSGLSATVSVAGSSFGDLFAGALGLSQLAVVQRVDGGAVNLSLVETAPHGSMYAQTLTDYHLLHLDGDPVASVERLSPPNAIEVTQIVSDDQGKTKSDSAKVSAYDVEMIMHIGQVQESYSVPSQSREQLLQVVTARAASLFGAEPDAQAVQVAVVPWFPAQPGDLILCDLTSPILYDYATVSTGYAGKARVTGREQHPKTGAVTLTLILEGRSLGSGLCPAPEVLDWDVAAAPSWIEVDAQHKPWIDQALIESAGAFQVLHFWPGDSEGEAQRYLISAATLISGACRLTVIAQVGAFSLSLTKRSTITLPKNGAVYTFAWFQQFAHTDDGSRWI